MVTIDVRIFTHNSERDLIYVQYIKRNLFTMIVPNDLPLNVISIMSVSNFNYLWIHKFKNDGDFKGIKLNDCDFNFIDDRD